MSTPCCSVGARLDAPALAALNEALAQIGQPGAETLTALAGRHGLPKGTLSKHRTGCLGLASAKGQQETAGKRPRETPSVAPENGEISRETRSETAPSRFAAKNPGDDPVTAPRKVITATLEEQCVDLRAKGKSYAEIAGALEIHEDTAQDMVERVLIRTRRGTDAKADAARRLDLLRIDKLLGALWDRATDPSMAKVDVPADTESGVKAYDGQDKAVDRVTKLLERRAKLLGLDAPEKVSVTLLDKADESPDFTEIFRVIRKTLDAKYPGATATVTEALDHYRVRGELGVDAFLAGDMALPVVVESSAAPAQEQTRDAVDRA